MYTDQQLFALRDYLRGHGCTSDNYQVVTPLPQRMQFYSALPNGFFAHQIIENRTHFAHQIFVQTWLHGAYIDEILTHDDTQPLDILLGENACEITLDHALDLVLDQRFGGYDFAWEPIYDFAHQTTFLSMVSPGNKKKKFSAQNKRFKIEFIWDYPKCYATNPKVLLSAHDRQTEFDFSAFYHPEFQFDTAFLAWLLPPDLLKSTLLPFDSDSLTR